MQRHLSLDANPPLSLPMRYFLSAPLFAVLAAALLLWQGPALLGTRWSPMTLALTHLLTLGCLTMTMAGALLQLLPVVAGSALPQVARVGAAVHAALCIGTLALASAFWRQQAWLFQAALALLLPALLLFAGACTWALRQRCKGAAGAIVVAIRLALAALVVTLLLGAALASGFAWPRHANIVIPLMRMTDLHMLWGLLGWAGLLVMGVAFQVVPMFQATEPYPAWLARGLPAALTLLMAGASLASPGGEWQAGTLTSAAAGYALFAFVTLSLLARRKRPKADPTTLYWRTAMASALAAFGLWLLSTGGASLPQPLALAMGVLLVTGVALSAISGMLYKIVPFLVWYHLQTTLPGGCRATPGVAKIIPERHARLQYLLYLAALLMLLAACAWPDVLARAAGAAFGLALLVLWINLCRALLLYRRLRQPQTLSNPLESTTWTT
jgi:hypothetical protein